MLSTDCAASGGTASDRAGSGFAAQIDGGTHFVTALHVVAGCATQSIEYDGRSYSTSVKGVLLDPDLAELRVPAGLQLPPLPTASDPPVAGSSLEALGYGGATLAKSKTVQVRLSGATTTIAAIVKSAQTTTDLQRQGFPRLSLPVIDLEGGLFAGDSGAPLIDDAGKVVGIANGCLMQGAMPFSWAFPSSHLQSLVRSTEKRPRSAALGDALVGEEVAATQARASGRPGPAVMTCGDITLARAGTQTFARLVATADSFSASHLGVVQGYATTANAPIAPDASFDIYADPSSGISVALPQGFSLHSQGRDCVGLDAKQEVAITVSADRVSSFFNTSSFATAFTQRLARPGETMFGMPGFSTAPVQRADGMWVQRYAVAFAPPASPGGPGFSEASASEGYMTFAFRDGVMIEVAARSQVPRVAFRHNPTWFPAVAGVYSATFKLR